MQHPYHDMRGPPGRDPREAAYHMGADPRRAQMSPNQLIIQQHPQGPPPPMGGHYGAHPGVPPQQPMPEPKGMPGPSYQSSRRNSVDKPLLYSNDLGAYQPLDEELLTLPNQRQVFLSKHSTDPSELTLYTKPLLLGPSAWINPFCTPPTPDPTLHDTPLLLPRIKLTGVYYEDALVKQEKYLSYVIILSGEKGYWRVAEFGKRADALREMFYMAMNGYSTVWCGAFLEDATPWKVGGIEELVVCANVEDAVKNDDCERGVVGVIG